MLNLMPCRFQARSSSSRASLRSEVEEKETDTFDTKSCQKGIVESSIAGVIDSRSRSDATIEDPEREQESSSPLSSSSTTSVVTLGCCREVERDDTMDSESKTSLDDSATDNQEDAANENRDPESRSNLTTSTPLVCTNSKPPVSDVDK